VTTEKYTGMSRDTGKALTGLEHIQQSIRDILVTPVGSRVVRRKYGSLLSALIDQPQNAALRLQIMSTCYVAIIQWEPRVRQTGSSYESDSNGSGNLTATAQSFSLTVPVS
jgi:phage baseplate assembly protein W